MNFRQIISESKDVSIYKKLLCLLGTYCDGFPGTQVDNMFDALVNSGKKILPKDKKALDALNYIISCDQEKDPNIVNAFLNYRYSDLPASVRPVMKAGRRNETVFFCRGGKVSDKVKDLIDWEGKGGGFWSDADGKKVQLIAVISEE